jgi:hypothetical protein
MICIEFPIVCGRVGFGDCGRDGFGCIGKVNDIPTFLMPLPLSSYVPFITIILIIVIYKN